MAGLPQLVAAPANIDVVQLRADYQGKELTITELTTLYGIGRTRLYTFVRLGGWIMRRPRQFDRHQLVNRMLRILEVQVVKLEFAMDDPDTDESAVLQKLSVTLDRLLQAKDATARGRTPKTSRYVEEVRTKIARRIAQLDQA